MEDVATADRIGEEESRTIPVIPACGKPSSDEPAHDYVLELASNHDATLRDRAAGRVLDTYRECDVDALGES